MTLRLLDLFSGIGGFSYAAERIVGGFKTTQFVEREPYCQRVLSKHWPHVPIHDDICTFQPEPGSADVICGGWPCQDISVAGRQAGIKEGNRSGLFYEFMRIIRVVRPKYIIMENVTAILADGLDTVLANMAEAGFNVEWACISAEDMGACHPRDRWWGIGSAEGWGCRTRAAFSNAGIAPAKTSKDKTSTSKYITSTSHPNFFNLEGSRSKGKCQQSSSGGETGALWCNQGVVLSPNWRSYVSEPLLRRGDDGLSGRVDRLKALGNAVVPQVAAIPLARVRELAAANGCGIL